MTPEELIKLVDRAERGRACKDVILRQGCPDCEEYQRWDVVGARHELTELGFSSPARARSYAALWAALVKAQGAIHDDFCSTDEDGDHAAFCDDLSEALATTEEAQ